MAKLQNNNISNVLQNVNTNLNSPYLRNIYLKQADIEFEGGNVSNSVFYQTEALCMGYRCKYLATHDDTPSEKIEAEPVYENALLTYAAMTMGITMTAKSKQQKEPKKMFETDPKAGMEAIRQFCMSLPKEWTVVQLCKSFNPKTSSSLKSEIMTAGNPIYLTVLKNTQSDLYSDPLSFKIEMKLPALDVYSLCHDISEKLKNGSNILAKDEGNLAYNMNLKSVERDIRDTIQSLKTLLGPWRCFFSGPAVRASQAAENEIYEKVKQLSIDNDLNTKQYVILCHLARKAKELTDHEISRACFEVTEDIGLHEILKEFLIDCRQTYSEHLECYPCILIVDELLDHFFWEMVDERQELCRISSLHLLQSIYSKYKDKVMDGYVRLSINQGKWILNPDKTLNEMEQRISAFIRAWDPKVDCVVDRQPPTADRITKYLQESDIFIYSGHGSGLQFFNGHKITNLKSNSVIFLLGCDSVRLKSDGLHSEMLGSHLYYFATQCPAVIGAILMAFDRKMDLLTTDILSTWIATKSKTHWRSVDKKLWAKEAKVEFKKSDGNKDWYEPRLSRILCSLRQKGETLHNRVHFVYRGLPVLNVNVE